MAYKCPRCGGPVKRGPSGVVRVGGVVGSLFNASLGSLRCAKCGKIKRSEFPQEAQRKMTRGTLLLLIPAVLLLLVVLVLVFRQ